jgi:hypothetical protein
MGILYEIIARELKTDEERPELPYRDPLQMGAFWGMEEKRNWFACEGEAAAQTDKAAYPAARGIQHLHLG